MAANLTPCDAYYCQLRVNGVDGVHATWADAVACAEASEASEAYEMDVDRDTDARWTNYDECGQLLGW